MVTPFQYVAAPPVTPLPFGLLSVAVVTDDETARWAWGGVEYQPDHCGPSYVTDGACAPEPASGVEITLTGGDAALTFTGEAAEDATIEWGDGTRPSGATSHTYESSGAYPVVVTAPNGRATVVPLTVDTAATEPVTVAAEFGREKIPHDGIGLVRGAAFAAYHLLTCRMPAGGWAEGQERARAALRLGESRAVERAMAWALSQDPEVVDLTPTGGALAPVEGLAVLEEHAAEQYGGVPTVHVPRGVGTLLTAEGAVGRQGTRLETVQGALVASGGGYSGPLGLRGPAAAGPAADGEAWLYVTGQVTGRRAQTIEVQEFGRTPATNQFVALAERPWVTAYECLVAAVRVTRTHTGGTDGGTP